MTKEFEAERLYAVLQPLLNRIFDYDVPVKVAIDRSSRICINGTAIGDYRLARHFELTDDFLLKFDYGENKKRFVNFGVREFEKINRVKEIIEYEKGGTAKAQTVWSENYS